LARWRAATGCEPHGLARPPGTLCGPGCLAKGAGSLGVAEGVVYPGECVSEALEVRG
jgi:hypothetical protein